MDNTATNEIPEFDFDAMTQKEILDTDLYDRIFSLDDISRTRIKIGLLKRAKELRCKSDVEMILREYERENKRKAQEERLKKEYVTQFEPDSNDVTYPDLYCGAWEATEDGIYSLESSQAKQIACYHPILPVRRLKNMQTGEEQITIAFKRNNLWEERTIPKTMIATARSITDLAKYGIAVTSENAKLLVRYLSDVENWNSDMIDVQQSTSKLGWHGTDFIPFDATIKFDGENQFKDLFESVSESGEFSIWKEHILKLRSTKSVEVRFALAAAFSSVILKFIGIYPFIVDFWTMTEAGKTVLNMVAASVWGNPGEAKYIGDFKTTDIALEARLDMLNNLPCFLDDTSKASKRIRENFESVIYDICSGKGKTRSNLKLGNDRDRNWQTVVICNGERPLSSYTFQGGAINRILEVECERKIFETPSKTADIVRYNYGFAGRMFVDQIKKMTKDEIKSIHNRYIEALTTPESMQKQVSALAAVMTADEIATKYVFQDDNQLTCDEVSFILTNRNEISDGERCYRYILDIINEQHMHFSTAYTVPQWGIFERQNNIYTGEEELKVVYFYVTAFENIVSEAGFSRKSFTSWAIDNDLLLHDKGRDRYSKKVNGVTQKFIAVKIDYEFEEHKEPIFD